ncbi:MAG: phosphorylcholine transferase LicD [Parabacteroides merdae]
MENNYLKRFKENELRSCQLKQLEILKIFDRICRKHNLRYWIDGGTLLGAVRHKGFIPWDDDLDVAMPSEDYKKLDQIIQSELPDHLFWQTPKNGSDNALWLY